MTARITLILTMLLATAHSPFCRCSLDKDGSASAQAQQCSHCCERESGSRPCPAGPDCCCRSSRILMLADVQDSGFTHSQPVVVFFDGEASLLAREFNTSIVVEFPEVDSGGRAHLMRSRRLLI